MLSDALSSLCPATNSTTYLLRLQPTITMAAEQQITLTDKLLAVPVGSRLLLASTTRLLSRPFSSGPHANTLFKDVIFAGLRKQLSTITTGTEQFIYGTTEAAYLDFAKKRGFQPDTDVLGENGPRLFWLGSKSAEKVVLYCHGGGYAMAGHAGHFEWLVGLQEHLSKTKSTSAVVIGYTLSPYGKYPTQLRQAAEALQHLLNQQKKPGDVSGLNARTRFETRRLMSRRLDHPRRRFGRRKHDFLAVLAPASPAPGSRAENHPQ